MKELMVGIPVFLIFPIIIGKIMSLIFGWKKFDQSDKAAALIEYWLAGFVMEGLLLVSYGVGSAILALRG